MIYDWSHKQLNPNINRPEYCPKCGTNLIDYGWMTTPNRDIICLRCGGSFPEQRDYDDWD